MTNMNSNLRMDPMLSSFAGDSIWNTKIIADIDIPSGQYLSLTSCDPVSPSSDSLLSSPEMSGSSFTDLASLWNNDNEQKRVTSVKIEEDEGFSDIGSSVMDTEEDDLMKEDNISTVSDDVASLADSPCSGDDEASLFSHSPESNGHSHSVDFITASESEARRYVEEKFLQIAYVPNPNSSHREKIEYILSLSDCTDYSIGQVMDLDKKSSDSARVCAKIVQNIPQQYRWDCVQPEQIPACYTIVADCKKTSSRDKPPRPMNAFMIWAQGARRLINELCPKMQNAAISEALGYCWRQKSDDFKKRFELEKAKLRRFHDYEFPAYKYKPKTKVQKAKEKEELSLSKAKLSKSGNKRKKPCEIIPTPPKEPTNATNARKGRCGRPKKIKLSNEANQPKVTKQRSETANFLSEPTKPEIKDMLTLKIMNDRRTKRMRVIDANSSSTSNHDNVKHFLGQLSPTETESPNSLSSDTHYVFEDLSDLESNPSTAVPPCTDALPAAPHQHRHFPSPSVYDTPANTPPIDADDTQSSLHLSPVHHSYHHSPQQKRHQPPPPTPPPPPQQQQQHQHQHTTQHQQQRIQQHSQLVHFQQQHQLLKTFTTQSSLSELTTPVSVTTSPVQQNRALSSPSPTTNSNVNGSTNISGSNNTKCLLSPQASMPSLTAILSSGPKNIANRDSLTLVHRSSPIVPRMQQPSPHHSQQQQQQQLLLQQESLARVSHSPAPTLANSRAKSRMSSTDVILTCVSELLDLQDPIKDSSKLSDTNSLKDGNNNNSMFYDFNNNTNNNNNNNNNNSFLRSWESFSADASSSGTTLSGLLNPKMSAFVPAKIFDFSDIDTLCPDLNVPLLSDDLMSSYLNTL